MPYEPIANLSRRGEKIAPFVSVQNAAGMVALAGLGWLCAAPFPGVMRFLLTIVLALAGYLITMDLRGMSIAERALWRLRGRVRILLRGRAIRPDDLPGTVTQALIPVMRRDGPIRLRLSPPEAIAAPARMRAAGRATPVLSPAASAAPPPPAIGAEAIERIA